jgi:hypothetical protein
MLLMVDLIHPRNHKQLLYPTDVNNYQQTSYEWDDPDKHSGLLHYQRTEAQRLDKYGPPRLAVPWRLVHRCIYLLLFQFFQGCVILQGAIEDLLLMMDSLTRRKRGV